VAKECRLRNFGRRRLAIRGLHLETLAIELDAAEIIDLSQRYHLQGYDVVYFELARRLTIPIASVDGGLKTACGIFGVALL
jgi:predicted nucleic acid-binding protein